MMTLNICFVKNVKDNIDHRCCASAEQIRVAWLCSSNQRQWNVQWNPWQVFSRPWLSRWRFLRQIWLCVVESSRTRIDDKSVPRLVSSPKPECFHPSHDWQIDLPLKLIWQSHWSGHLKLEYIPLGSHKLPKFESEKKLLFLNLVHFGYVSWRQPD